MKIMKIVFSSENEYNECTQNLPAGTWMDYTPNADLGTNTILMDYFRYHEFLSQEISAECFFDTTL